MQIHTNHLKSKDEHVHSGNILYERNLSNNIVPSTSPFSRSLDDIKKLKDDCMLSVVLYLLFEE